mgnify:CR=1 FL=1
MPNSRIGGNVTETGGGGGETCAPSGVFAAFGSPVYSDYEDSIVLGSVSIANLTSCWLGVARVSSGGGMAFVNVQLADPDGVEIINNTVGGDLVDIAHLAVAAVRSDDVPAVASRQLEIALAGRVAMRFVRL